MLLVEPVVIALEAISKALADEAIERVILIAHSQGTIITSNMLRTLVDPTARRELIARSPRLTAEHAAINSRPQVFRHAEALARGEDRGGLGKLEVYSFATAASTMSGKALRHIEHFANEWDYVANLGVLSPRNCPAIDGRCYLRKASGHLFGAHYLSPIQEDLAAYGRGRAPFADPSEKGQSPRLYQYFNGASPKA